MNIAYEKINDTLSFFGVNCKKDVYVSTGSLLKEYPDEIFRMDHYCLCLCLAGDASVLIEEYTYDIHAQMLLVARPSTMMKFIETSADFKIKLLFFEKNFLTQHLADQFILDKINLFQNTTFTLLSITASEEKKWLQHLDTVEAKLHQKGLYQSELIQTIIYYLLLEVADFLDRQQLHQTIYTTGNLYLKFHELVRQHVLEQRALDYYANSLFISQKYLIQEVKKHSGKTPGKIIDEELMKEAYLLLNNTEYNIAEVAYLLTFSSGASFTRFFKKHSTLTPLEYRRKNLR